MQCNFTGLYPGIGPHEFHVFLRIDITEKGLYFFKILTAHFFASPVPGYFLLTLKPKPYEKTTGLTGMYFIKLHAFFASSAHGARRMENHRRHTKFLL